MAAPKYRIPDLRGFGDGKNGWVDLKRYVNTLWDPDARRSIQVITPNPHGFDLEPDYVREITDQLEKAAAVLAPQRDSLPDGDISVELDEAGKLLSVAAGVEEGFLPRQNPRPLEEFQLPPAVAARTVLRSELTEIGRNPPVVAYPPSLCPGDGSAESASAKNRYVFKTDMEGGPWDEMHVAARLPPHPNMVLLDRLVLDEMGGSRVVGFTMRYVPSESLATCWSKVRFKLKWLRELMQAVDDLNFRHGIIHQDIADRNLLVDPETDSILLIDFGDACHVGAQRGRGGAGGTGASVETMSRVLWSSCTTTSPATRTCSRCISCTRSTRSPSSTRPSGSSTPMCSSTTRWPSSTLS
jgi:hypothetical protein